MKIWISIVAVSISFQLLVCAVVCILDYAGVISRIISSPPGNTLQADTSSLDDKYWIAKTYPHMGKLMISYVLALGTAALVSTAVVATKYYHEHNLTLVSLEQFRVNP